MNKKYQVSESELEVLKVIWKLERCTSNEIVEQLENTTTWSLTTIKTLLSRLVVKDVLEVDKSNKRSYIYSSNVTEDEYRKFANESFLGKLYNGSINMMMSTFIKDKNLNKQELKELKDLIDKEL